MIIAGRGGKTQAMVQSQARPSHQVAAKISPEDSPVEASSSGAELAGDFEALKLEVLAAVR